MQTTSILPNMSAPRARAQATVPLEGTPSFAAEFQAVLGRQGEEAASGAPAKAAAAPAATPQPSGKRTRSTAEIAAEKAAAQKALHAAVAQELKDYLEKSPAQRLREAVLKELGLTEEDLAKMPPEKRAAVEAEINERIRTRLLGREPEDQEAFLRESRIPVQRHSGAATGGAGGVFTFAPMDAAFNASGAVDGEGGASALSGQSN